MNTPMTTAAVVLTTCHPNATICSGTSCLVPSSNYNEILSLVLSIVLTVMLAMVMFAMGCTVEVTKLWGHIKRPWGIFIGFLCQFGIMPFTAFALSLAFNVLPVQAVVIIIMGCCPACSSILALGMMPLCLLIYTSVWTSADTIQIPYQSIAIYPFVGFTLGFFMARFVGQPWHRCRTIALETGFQNSQLCSTIVQLSFSTEELEVMFAFPLIYSIFQLVVAVMSVGAYQMYKRKCGGGSSELDGEGAEWDAEAPPSKDKQEYVLENGGFECDENGNNGEKGKITQM
ncbi:unnamed protein product [Coregonus sp. 'balchen']|nr:unnamed protein product [Coregonus sp. 'balchen']